MWTGCRHRICLAWKEDCWFAERHASSPLWLTNWLEYIEAEAASCNFAEMSSVKFNFRGKDDVENSHPYIVAGNMDRKGTNAMRAHHSRLENTVTLSSHVLRSHSWP